MTDLSPFILKIVYRLRTYSTQARQDGQGAAAFITSIVLLRKRKRGGEAKRKVGMLEKDKEFLSLHRQANKWTSQRLVREGKRWVGENPPVQTISGDAHFASLIAVEPYKRQQSEFAEEAN